MSEAVDVCRACADYIGGDADPLIAGGCREIECAGCGGEQMPDRVTWRRRLAEPSCPKGRFPPGTRPTQFFRTTPGPNMASAGEAFIQQRAVACRSCAKHFGSYGCRVAGGPINRQLLDPRRRCPADPPVWVEVTITAGHS